MFVRINETFVAGEEISSLQLGERKRKKTTITQLRSEEGEMIQQSTAIEKHILRYFTELYTENEPANDEQIDDLFECDRVVPENDERD